MDTVLLPCFVNYFVGVPKRTFYPTFETAIVPDPVHWPQSDTIWPQSQCNADTSEQDFSI